MSPFLASSARCGSSLLVTALLAAAAASAEPAAVGLPRGDAQTAGFDGKKIAAIDRLLKTSVERRQIAGGAALVARRGRVVHVALAGRQDAEAGQPVSESTIYRIASMTKPLTSVAAMMLVEEGTIALDDPVAKYLPEFASLRVLPAKAPLGWPIASLATPAQTPLTVRHLLTHTSGLSYGFWNRPVLGQLYRDAGVSDGLLETPGDMADNVRRLVGLPLMFEPGAQWEYGLNTDVLGRLIEVASGQTLDQFFSSRIFGPLQLQDTHFVLPAHKRARLAALYTPDEMKHIRRVPDGPQVSTSAIGIVHFSATYPLSESNRYHSGGAGLVSTLGDYARFLQMLLNGGQLDGRQLLKAETIAQMTRNQIGDLAPGITSHGDKFGYGLGIVTAASKPAEPASVGSYSWGGIFYTYFLVDPEQELLAICLTQLFPWDHLTLHDDFKRAVYESLNNK